MVFTNNGLHVEDTNCTIEDNDIFYYVLQSITVNKKVCILYLKNGYAAERSFRVKDIIDIYIKENFSQLEPIYLEITKNKDIDFNNLKKIETNVFISALGSGDCKYLNEIFFENEEHAIHINSYSTASYLYSAKKLLRIQIPDKKIPVVYYDLLKKSNSTNLYIVYMNGTYYQGLKNDLINSLPNNINLIGTLNIDEENFNAENILNIAQNNSNLSIIFIVDLPMILIDQLMIEDTKNILYNIYISDSGAQDLPKNDQLLKYVQSKESKLITKFISDDNLILAYEYNKKINDPEHPTSTVLSLFLNCFDLAENMSLTKFNDIYKRKRYINILLDENLDNTEALWGIYSYTKDIEYNLSIFGLTFYYGSSPYTAYK
jgi:hypothetical protein